MKVQVAETRTFKSEVEYASSAHNAPRSTLSFTFYKKLMDSADNLVKVEREIKVEVSEDAVVVSVSDERVIRSRMAGAMRQGETPAQPSNTTHNVKGKYSELLEMNTPEQIEHIGKAYVIPLFQ